MIGYIAKSFTRKLPAFPKIEGLPGRTPKDIVVEVSCIVGAIMNPFHNDDKSLLLLR
ncbi:MAG: hypothetical protein SCALA702_01750 [Melioribacteraceae bacterium]|nr:MAG: hypothetical protein SCALA702_01750 [Melioribacteraceae bacterium]